MAAELEFAQIIIIVVVVTVMVVVIVCLLNHYKVSTRSFINRPSQSRRREDGLPQVSTPATWSRVRRRPETQESIGVQRLGPGCGVQPSRWVSWSGRWDPGDPLRRAGSHFTGLIGAAVHMGRAEVCCLLCSSRR